MSTFFNANDLPFCERHRRWAADKTGNEIPCPDCIEENPPASEMAVSKKQPENEIIQPSPDAKFVNLPPLE
jgi:hypothetical protein